MIDRYEIIGNMVRFYVKRTRGKYPGEYECFIDLADFEYVKDLPLNIVCRQAEIKPAFYIFFTTYLGLTSEGKVMNESMALHTYLMGIKGEHRRIVVDHENHNGLDNRRGNLRIASSCNNLRNREQKNKNNTSGYRNVSWIDGYWRVQLQIDGRNTRLPEKFDDVDEAGRFAEKMRRKHYGEYAGEN
jgi:hypothetical protein